MSEQVVSVHLNPLTFIEWEEPWSSIVKREVTAEVMLAFLCSPHLSSDLDALQARYKQISTDIPSLSVAPDEVRLLERMIWPLRHAKGSFVLGNYLGTIALCGLVAEMSAILAFDLHNERDGTAELDTKKQEAFFGRRFEKLGQERRVAVLRGLGLLDDKSAASFETVRSRRNKYLHLWSEEHLDLSKDAADCFGAAVSIVKSVLGLSFDQGRLVLRPQLIAYLRRHGVGPSPAADRPTAPD